MRPGRPRRQGAPTAATLPLGGRIPSTACPVRWWRSRRRRCSRRRFLHFAAGALRGRRYRRRRRHFPSAAPLCEESPPRWRRAGHAGTVAAGDGARWRCACARRPPASRAGPGRRGRARRERRSWRSRSGRCRPAGPGRELREPHLPGGGGGGGRASHAAGAAPSGPVSPDLPRAGSAWRAGPTRSPAGEGGLNVSA